MSRRLALSGLTAGLALAAAGAAWAQDSCQTPAPVSRHHQAVIGGHRLGYTSQAGFLPLADAKTGATTACVFYVAYRLDRAPGAAPRPVSFIWNGGPGANSSYLHLEAFGPRRIAGSDDPSKPDPDPLTLEDNSTSLLPATDMVFVDAVGTGFSRATSPRYEEGFYNVRGDASAFAQAVQAWRGRFGRPREPLYLIGESYGVWRAAAVSEILEQQGTRVAGEVLISGGVPTGPVMSPELKTALFIPNRTAAADYFGKLAAGLEGHFDTAVADAGRWALDVYAPALARAEQLTPAERDGVVEGLARYTGLDAAKVDRTTLVVTRKLLAEDLVGDGRTRLGTLDIRAPHGEENAPARVALTRRYLAEEIGFDPGRPYVFDTRIGESWGYNQAGPKPDMGPGPEQAAAHPTAAAAWHAANDGPPGGSQPWLLHAMARDPGLRALVVAGWYDSLNSCAGNAWLSAHLDGPARGRVKAICYRTGHMIYRDRSARAPLNRDISEFLAAGVRR